MCCVAVIVGEQGVLCGWFGGAVGICRVVAELLQLCVQGSTKRLPPLQGAVYIRVISTHTPESMHVLSSEPPSEAQHVSASNRPMAMTPTRLPGMPPPCAACMRPTATAWCDHLQRRCRPRARARRVPGEHGDTPPQHLPPTPPGAPAAAPAWHRTEPVCVCAHARTCVHAKEVGGAVPAVTADDDDSASTHHRTRQLQARAAHVGGAHVRDGAAPRDAHLCARA